MSDLRVEVPRCEARSAELQGIEWREPEWGKLQDKVCRSWLWWYWKRLRWSTKLAVGLAGAVALAAVLALCWLVPTQKREWGQCWNGNAYQACYRVPEGQDRR